MRIIKGRKRGKNKKPTLILKIHVIQAENIEALKTFNCNPVCFVTTNTFYSQKTNKLKNSNTHWNQTLRIKLPRNPTSEWLRIIVYDALPTGAPPTTPSRPRTTTANTSSSTLSNSGLSSHSHSSRNLNVTSKGNQTSTSINSVSSSATPALHILPLLSQQQVPGPHTKIGLIAIYIWVKQKFHYWIYSRGRTPRRAINFQLKLSGTIYTI